MDKLSRVTAMKWWNELPLYDADKLCKRFLSNFFYGREPESLTGREIQKIYKHKH